MNDKYRLAFLDSSNALQIKVIFFRILAQEIGGTLI